MERIQKKFSKILINRTNDINHVDDQIYTLALRVGREKGTGCPAIFRVASSYGLEGYKCLAKGEGLAAEYKIDLFRDVCSLCRFSRDSVSTRLLMRRLKGKK